MSGFLVEEESGTFTGTVRAHNGYWAGDFAVTGSRTDLAPWFQWGRAESEKWNQRPHPVRRVIGG